MSNEKIILLDLNVYSRIEYAVKNNLTNNIDDNLTDRAKFDEKLLKDIENIQDYDQEGYYVTVVPSLIETVNNPSNSINYQEQKEKFGEILGAFFEKAKFDTNFLDKIGTHEYIVSLQMNARKEIELIEFAREIIKNSFQKSGNIDRKEVSLTIIKKSQRLLGKNKKILSLLLVILIFLRKNLINDILKYFCDDKAYNAYGDLNIIINSFLYSSFVTKAHFLKTGKNLDVELLTFDKSLNEFFSFIKDCVQTKSIANTVIYTLNLNQSDFHNPDDIKEIFQTKFW